MPPGVAVTDAGYGNDTGFRDGVTGQGLAHVTSIQVMTALWPPGTGPLPAKPWGGKGRPRSGCVGARNISRSRLQGWR